MVRNIFDEDDGHIESDIEVDHDYARRFEHNKKREDLQRYEELKKKGLVDDDSDEESESESDEPEDVDLNFLNGLIKVRNQDPSLKNAEVKLFESDKSESEKDDEEGDKKKKKKAVYLKDVVAKQLIEEGPEFDDEEEEESGKYMKRKSKKEKTYHEEQEELRRPFLDAEQIPEDEDGDFLKVKEDNQEDLADEENDEKQDLKKELLDEYFGKDVDENKLFLKEYLTKKMWIDTESKDRKHMIDDLELEELEKDEEEIVKQEDYETSFRYEENAGDRVMGHSRKVDGSVRKKENARKEQRKSKEERMKIAEMERKEELKHLKNLKKKEIKERMKKVLSIAGFKEGEECPFSSKDLEDEFDPEEYDKMMKDAFDDKYYDEDDEELGSDDEDDEKPDFDKEDELLGLSKDWDVIKPGDGFLSTRERSLKHKLDTDGDHETDDNDEEEEEEEEKSNEEGEEEQEDKNEEGVDEGKRKRKKKVSLIQRAKEAMLEEYYKLDYEDTIGDLKTRFKYSKIKPNRYGLSSAEILAMDDKDLNQYVSLKKIAPYTEKEWKVPNSKRHQQKLKNKELFRGGKVEEKTKKKSKRSRDDIEKLDSAVVREDDQKTNKKKIKSTGEAESSKADESLSRRAKRRRNQSELKLSQSRLVAYGKIPSDSKGKKKNRD